MVVVFWRMSFFFTLEMKISSLFFFFFSLSISTFGVNEPDELVRAGKRRVDGVSRDARVGAGEDGARGVAGELADSCCGVFFFRVFFSFGEVERCRVGG